MGGRINLIDMSVDDVCWRPSGCCAGSARRTLCLKKARLRRLGEPSVRAKPPQHRRVRSYTRRSARFAAVNTGQGRRSRRLRLAFRRPGAPGSPFDRQEKAGSRSKLAGAPNTPMKPVSISANLVIDRGSPAQSRRSSNGSREGLRPTGRSRAKPSAPLLAAPPPSALPLPARRCERKVPPAVPPPPAERRKPERVARHSARTSPGRDGEHLRQVDFGYGLIGSRSSASKRLFVVQQARMKS